MSNPLVEVRRASEGIRAARVRYRAALLAAVDELEASGRSDPYSQVSRAAGVSRQSVFELVARARAAL